MTFTTYLSAQGLLKAGKLRAVGVASGNRLPLLPDVPTFNESGFKDFEIGTMFGLLAPARTPKDIVQKIYAVLEAAAQTKEFRDQIIEQGGEVVVNAPEEFTSYIASEVEKWKKLVKQIGNIDPS
jgi:tripartite-type tricarboxylate transporter receptor subunit TctC